MKKIIPFIVCITFGVVNIPMVYADAEIKTICRDKKGKDGKVILDKKGNPVQNCKKIKIHKKLEGTKVPDPKKKK